MPPVIGALRLVSSNFSALNVTWDITTTSGLRNPQFTLTGNGVSVTRSDGSFAGLNATTTYTAEATAEVRNVCF